MSFAAVIGLIAIAEWETDAREIALMASRLRSVRARAAAISSALRSRASWRRLRPRHSPSSISTARHIMPCSAILSRMPIMGFVIMPAAALAMFLMPLGLDRWPLQLMGRGVVMMMAVAHWVAELPGAASVAVAWPDTRLSSWLLAGSWIALWRRSWRWLGLVPILIGIVASTLPPRARSSDCARRHDHRAARARRIARLSARTGRHIIRPRYGSSAMATRAIQTLR